METKPRSRSVFFSVSSFSTCVAVDVLHQDFLADLHLAGRRLAEGVLAGVRHHRLEHASAADRARADRLLRVEVQLARRRRSTGALSKTNSVSPASFSFSAAAKGQPAVLRKPCSGPISRFSSSSFASSGSSSRPATTLRSVSEPSSRLVIAQRLDHRLAVRAR